MSRPLMTAIEDPTRMAVDVRIGRERVTLTRAMLEADAYGGTQRWMTELYDAAVRDVRASLSPLERPQPRVIRSPKGSRLAFPMFPGCSRSRNHR